MPKKFKDRLVVVTSCLGNSAARDTDINSLFSQKRDLSVLCGFASSMFVIVDRLRLFSMRSCPERMPSCRPKVQDGRMSHNLSVRDMIEPMIRQPDDSRRLTLLSQKAIEFGSQWKRTWKSGFSPI